MSYDDTRAVDHAPTDEVLRLLHRRDPRFDSAKDFGFFASIVIEEWHAGCPGLRSSAGGSIEMSKLGTAIQTSIALPRPPTLSYHLDWIRDVLRAALTSAAANQAKSNRRKVPSAADVAYADEVIQIWSQVDIHRDTHERVAPRFKKSRLTVTRRVDAGRRHIHTALERAGRLNT